MTEDVELCGITVRKGDLYVLNMQQMHLDKNEWQQPERFIPDRFDPMSPMYLKPNGTKRSSLAFNPFIGGKRICLGKTFAEVVAKFVVPALLGHFKFEHVDNDITNGIKPKIIQNLSQDCDPVVLMHVRPANLSKN